MKRCPNCGRVRKRKAWRKPTPADLRKAENFEPFEKEWCDDCMRREASHNAIIQIRGAPLEKFKPVVEMHLARNAGKGVVENFFEKNGNFYFSSKTTARRIAGDLKKMGAEIKETSKLVTYDRQGSRPLMRLTISARFKVAVGDIVETKAGPDIADRVDGSWVWTRKGHKIKLKDVVKLESEAFEGVLIADSPPMATLKATGETVDVEAAPGVEAGREVILRGFKGKWWVAKK